MKSNPTNKTGSLPDCSGCTDPHSEGTHQAHSKQHPCPEGGGPDCGYCFPANKTGECCPNCRRTAQNDDLSVSVFCGFNRCPCHKSFVVGPELIPAMKNAIEAGYGEELIIPNQETTLRERVENITHAICYGDMEPGTTALLNLIQEELDDYKRKVREALEDNLGETLWGDEDSNEVMRISLKNYKDAVTSELGL